MLWLILLQLEGLLALRWRTWRTTCRRQKVAWSLSTTAAVALAMLSTPLTAHVIEASLATGRDYTGQTAAYIFVLAGGFEPGIDLEGDVLTMETSRRVLAAVAWWREDRAAKLVFSGATDLPGRPAARMVELMAEEAVARGVPADRIVLEDRSAEAWRHPFENPDWRGDFSLAHAPRKERIPQALQHGAQFSSGTCYAVNWDRRFCS